MAKAKKGALCQLFVPMVDATDFASIESGITESDFNSGVTKKFYGMNHGGSAAMTSGTISKPGSLVRSGVFRITLKGTENNYDVMMARFTKTGCAEQILTWENVDNDDSDLMSYLAALSATISDTQSYLVAMSGMLSDTHSAAILGASTASLAQVQATAAASRALLIQSTASNIYELTSDVQSYLVAVSGTLSDVQSALARHDANMVMRRNAVVTAAAATITLDAGAAAINSLYNDMTIAVIAGVGAGQVRAVQNYVGATKIATISPNWENVPVLGDSYVLLTNRTDHSHLEDTYSLLSQLNSYVVVMSDMLSDTYDMARLGASTASLAQVQATAAASRALLLQSTLSTVYELASDAHSAALLGASTASLAQVQATAAASRALLIQSTASNIYELTSDVQSFLTYAHSDLKSGLGAISVTLSPSDISEIASQTAASISGVSASDISKIASAVWATTIGTRVDSRVSMIQSQLSDFDSRMVADVSDLKSAIGNVSVTLTASDISTIASAAAAAVTPITESDISNIASAVWATTIGARVDSRVDAITSDTSDIISVLTVGVDLNAAMLSDIKSAIEANGLQASGVDVTGVVSPTGTYGAKLDWIAALARNKVTQDGSVQTLYDDAGSAVASAAVSDDGSVFTRDEWA